MTFSPGALLLRLGHSLLFQVQMGLSVEGPFTQPYMAVNSLNACLDYRIAVLITI